MCTVHDLDTPEQKNIYGALARISCSECPKAPCRAQQTGEHVPRVTQGKKRTSTFPTDFREAPLTRATNPQNGGRAPGKRELIYCLLLLCKMERRYDSLWAVLTNCPPTTERAGLKTRMLLACRAAFGFVFLFPVSLKKNVSRLLLNHRRQ